MKKIGLTLLGSLLVMNTYASPAVCGYKDFIHFSTDTPLAALITFANTDSDIYLQVVSARSFVLYDTPACHSGNAIVHVNLDAYSGCELHIKDGPLMRHPDVKALCVGNLNYVGIKYDGIGSRSYTMTFS